MNIKQLMAAFVKGARKGKAASVYIEGDTIYSYGRHFPLAVRTANGFLVNKDKYSVTTSKQQGYLKYELLGLPVAFGTTEELKAADSGRP